MICAVRILMGLESIEAICAVPYAYGRFFMYWKLVADFCVPLDRVNWSNRMYVILSVSEPLAFVRIYIYNLGPEAHALIVLIV